MRIAFPMNHTAPLVGATGLGGEAHLQAEGSLCGPLWAFRLVGGRRDLAALCRWSRVMPFAAVRVAVARPWWSSRQCRGCLLQNGPGAFRPWRFCRFHGMCGLAGGPGERSFTCERRPTMPVGRLDRGTMPNVTNVAGAMRLAVVAGVPVVRAHGDIPDALSR